MTMNKSVNEWITDLSSEEKSIRDEAIRVLGYMGEPAVASLMDVVEHQEINLDAVAMVVKQIGTPAIDPLTVMLRTDEDNILQAKAARILAHTGDYEALAELIITLKDDDPHVRAEVAHALGEFKDSRALGPLLNALKDEQPMVRSRAAHSLGSFDDMRVAEALLGALDDEDWEVRQNVIQGLTNNSDDRVEEALMMATKDPQEEVRQMAAAALQHRQGDSVAFERLNADKDISDDLKAAVDDILRDGKVDEDDQEVLRHSNPRIRSGLLRYVAEKRGVGTVPLLLPGLNDINPAVRASAAEALEVLGESAVEPLIAALGNESRYIRAGVAGVLGGIGDQRAIEPLIDLLGDEHARVRIGVLQALATWNEDRVVNAIAGALKDADQSVQEAANAALVSMGYDPSKMGSKLPRFFRRFLGGN